MAEEVKAFFRGTVKHVDSAWNDAGIINDKVGMIDIPSFSVRVKHQALAKSGFSKGDLVSVTIKKIEIR